MRQNMRCPGNMPKMGVIPGVTNAPMGCNTMPPMGQYETCSQIVEQPVNYTPEQHHYHRVDHIVPVVIRNVHHHHNQHQYIIDRKESVESYRYDEYLANPTVITQPLQGFYPMNPQPSMLDQSTMINQAALMQQMSGQTSVTPQNIPQSPQVSMNQSIFNQMISQNLM